MGNFSVEVSGEIDESLHPLIQVLRSLKELPEFPFDVFYSLVTNCLDDLSVSLDGAALATGNLRAVVRPGRNLELVTAALLALERYLHS
ncbi:hypothetical protein [Pseudomonas sp. MWU12-2345]|uniref:hypothetical protein n=1 Tax=Pseudomonas sp. MWU12-2345 TaxID=2928689 RepID=UPI00200D02C7|nr:hypothetical protein [Pseudomonas sp. MWU12-2345]